MSDAGAVLWGMCDGVGAGVLIQGHCCALMLELLFGHVSVAACGADHMYSDAALMLPCCMCSDAGA